MQLTLGSLRLAFSARALSHKALVEVEVPVVGVAMDPQTHEVSSGQTHACVRS